MSLKPFRLTSDVIILNSARSINNTKRVSDTCFGSELAKKTSVCQEWVLSPPGGGFESKTDLTLSQGEA